MVEASDACLGCAGDFRSDGIQWLKAVLPVIFKKQACLAFCSETPEHRWGFGAAVFKNGRTLQILPFQMPWGAVMGY